MAELSMLTVFNICSYRNAFNRTVV